MIMTIWMKLNALLIVQIALSMAAGVNISRSNAQIVPDATLGNERSQVVPVQVQGAARLLIEGGAQRGVNLFHSFSDFNVKTGEKVYFGNPGGATTILTRVTGGQLSNIDGILGVNGKANLFFMNPNGIVFGKSATLDLESGFTATTMTSIQLGSDVTFSATEPKIIPQVIFLVPVGIQLGQVVKGSQGERKRADILVQGPIPFTHGIALISEGGIDTSRGSIGRDIANSYDRVLNRLGISDNDISLEARGDIKTGNIFSLRTITITSYEGYIDTSAGRLSTQVGVRKSDNSNRGNITLKANDKIIAGSMSAGGVAISFPLNRVVDGKKAFVTDLTNPESKIYYYDTAYPQELDFYRSGNIEITAPYIKITEGAKVSTSNTIGAIRDLSEPFFPYGVVPGSVIVNASESLVIDGVDKKGNVGGLFSESIKESFTLPGKIQISTGNLIVKNSGVISIRSESEIQMDKVQMELSDRANIRINANSVILQSGGKITTTTSRFSNSGLIEISARDRILLSGLDSGIFANTVEGSTGKGGDIRINASNGFSSNIVIQDGAGINVNSLGSGTGGNLIINARNLNLSNKGFISSETDRANGGNLNLNIDKILLLRKNSTISTSAGTSRTSDALGKGGDIDIVSRFIIAPSYENSDIKANAFNGEGGTVNINAEKIFGMSVRSRDDLIRLLGSNNPKDLDPIRLSTNDVTAISQNNPILNGSVEVSQLSVDPTRGLNAESLLPQRPNVSEDCGLQNQAKASRITSSGRGGITPTPIDSLTGSMIWQDPNQTIATAIPSPPENTLPIAQGWIQKSNGNVLLVGGNTPSSPTPTCHVH